MKKRIKKYISLLILLISLIIIFSTLWVKNTFEFESFEVMLYTLILPKSGTPRTLLLSGFINCLMVPIIITILIYYIYKKIITKNQILDNKIHRYLIIIVIPIFAFSLVFIYKKLGIDNYIERINDSTKIFEKYCVDAKEVEYEFPEKKRNLILIYLESMETSYYNKEQGGAYDECLIPELYQLSIENTIFTDKNNQGYNVAPHAGHTIAADVASLCGIPFGSMFEGNPEDLSSENFLPGAYGLGDILKDNGYSNILLCGSDGHFASTDSFFIKHGNFEIEDYYYAIRQNWIEEGYMKGFGYEDEALFEFAKIELESRNSIGKPFFLVMKTTDSHNPDGNTENCECKFEYPIMDAIKCSSKKVVDFINWIKKQDFYSNTTIVLAGDHKSMAKDIKETIDSDYNRKIYFVILNPAIDKTQNIHRTFCTYDLFPTMLASIGVKFNSDRLGLGTNLYSNSKTLMEEMGDQFFKEVSKHSDYYVNKFVLNKQIK